MDFQGRVCFVVLQNTVNLMILIEIDFKQATNV